MKTENKNGPDPANPMENDSHSRYWIIEVQLSDTALCKFLRLCEEAGLSMEEYFNRLLRHACNHPEEISRLKEEAEKNPHENKTSDVEVIRIYPVYDCETESEARERAVREEAD